MGIKSEMAASSIVVGMPTKVGSRTSHIINAQRPVFSNSFLKGSGPHFIGQRLQLEASTTAGPRCVTAMAAKGEGMANWCLISSDTSICVTMCYILRRKRGPGVPTCSFCEFIIVRALLWAFPINQPRFECFFQSNVQSLGT